MKGVVIVAGAVERGCGGADGGGGGDGGAAVAHGEGARAAAAVRAGPSHRGLFLEKYNCNDVSRIVGAVSQKGDFILARTKNLPKSDFVRTLDF